MQTALDSSLAWPTGNLKAYQRAVQAFPLLSAEEEDQLARQYRDANDWNAAWRLVTSHLRFVVKIARGYEGYGIPKSDLIQEGNVGLMKAVKRFDPDKGVRLASFAIHHIRAEIHEYILRNWRMAKVATGRAQRKLFYKLRQAKKSLGWVSREESEEIAAALGVKPHEVVEMDVRLATQDTAFDGATETGAGEFKATPASYLEDRRYEPSALIEEDDWREHSLASLTAAMDSLDPRSREIVERRWMDEPKATLQELAERYSVSVERIRQIEKRALEKLRATATLAA